MLVPALITLLIGASASCNVTVDPAGIAGTVKTLAAAQLAVQEALSASAHIFLEDFTICLARGIHDVSRSPLVFSSIHSVARGDGRVVWRGSPGAVVSGGTQIVGWTPTTLGGGDVYSAVVPPPEAQTPLRQLWVAGTRANRTTLDGSAVSLVPWISPDGSAGYTVSGGGPAPPGWATNSTTAIEFTFALVVQNWIEPRCTVASVIGGNITLSSPCGAFLASRFSGHKLPLPPPVRIEAVPLWPLAPGTFYHDVDG